MIQSILNLFRKTKIKYHLNINYESYIKSEFGSKNVLVETIFLRRCVDTKRMEGFINMSSKGYSFTITLDEHDIIEMFSPAIVSIHLRLKLHWWAYEDKAQIMNTLQVGNNGICYISYTYDTQKDRPINKIELSTETLNNIGFFNFEPIDYLVRKKLKI